jgi:histidinol-phosphatase
MTPFLSAALAAAEAAAAIIRRLYAENIAVEYKSDQSPVTRADVESERAIRAILAARFPDHGFYGEETGRERSDAQYLWLVDPIDGTKAFVRRYPMFSTQIALMCSGELILGVSNAPLYGELAYAERGAGAWLNGERVYVSRIERIEECALSAGNLRTLASSERWSAYGRLISRVNRIRGYGDFLHYHLLASGRIDAVVESDVNILDIAALAVIVQEAGGRFTDLDGHAVGLDTSSVLAANGRLHEALLAALGPAAAAERGAGAAR